MKILFVHNTYQHYGGEDAVLEAEINLLKDKGHEVALVGFHNNTINSLGTKLRTGLFSVYNTTSTKILEQKIRDFTPDVLHIHNLFFTASPSIIIKAYQMKVPVVMTIHNYRLICANAILLRNNKVCELCVNKLIPLDGIKYKCYRSSHLESALVTGITSVHKIIATWRKKVSQYIVLSNFANQKLLNSSLQLPQHKVCVKPNFIFDPYLKIDKRDDYFVFVGRLTIEKGIEVLLNCFELNPHLKLIIAGDGPQKENIKRKIETLPNINFIGQQPKEEILKLMSKSKALIFPSIWYEGLPTTIIEAFATGTPVIASNLGSMAEMIQHNYNGFLFEPNNVHSLELTINSVLSSGIELNKQARITYERNYHPEIHYTEILKIYKKAIEA